MPTPCAFATGTCDGNVVGKCEGEIEASKTNIWGGSIAYGHPFAATGGRLIMHAVDGLKHVDGEVGLVTACAAGGLGSAMVIERN